MSDEPDRQLAQYLAELDQIAPLDSEQERVLVAIIGRGRVAQSSLDQPGPLADEQRQALQDQVAAGIRARRRLLEAHLPLVVMLARKHQRGPLNQMDLIQEGNLGLIKALGAFDPAQGHRFPTYATWWIRQAMTVAERKAG